MNTSQVTLTKIQDLGNDVLSVEGTIEGFTDNEQQLRTVVAKGWVSAMTSHYDAEAYGEDGHRKEDGVAREMTKEEKQEYCKRLLLEQNPFKQDKESEAIDVDIL